MIVTKVQGGLGNQMFQYAAAAANSPHVYLDLDFLKNQVASTDTFTRRDFELTLFPNLRYKEASAFQKKIFFSKGLFYKLLRVLIPTRVLAQQDNEPVHICPDKHLYLDGYFQSEAYFRHARETILKLFSFPALDETNRELKDKILQAPHSVSLHIRRGDYLKPEVVKYHGILPLSYYHEALQLLQKEVGDTHIFVFSDDTKFVKDHFGDLAHVTIIEGNEKNAWKDMALMSYCRHHIVANSSFSWWGAWLSQHEHSIKIAPKNWFNAEVVKFNIDDIVPERWLKI